jgi:type IV secretion system protein VirB6
MQTMMMDVVRGAIVVTLVGNAGNFNQWIGTVFLTTIPNEVGQAINGSLGGSGPPVNGGAQFDAVWNTAYKAGLMVYNNLPSVSLKGVALTFCVFFFWGVALAAVAIGFLMFLASSVLMALLIAIGPIFIACALWPGSRAFFSGWIASCVSTVTAQILTVALMSLMLQVETAELGRIASNPANANEVGQIGSLLGVAALLGICSLLAKQIPAVAVGIAGGAYHNLNSYANAIGAAGTAGSKLINMARGPSGGGGSGSGGSPARPSAQSSFVGRSMSGS